MDKDQVFDVKPARAAAATSTSPRAWMQQHRTHLAAGSAAAVALLALVMRSRANSAAAAPGQATRVVPPGSSYGDPQDFRGAAGAGVYDSTASDVYNSLQPQIEQVQRMLEELQGLTPGTAPVPGVKPADPAPKPAPKPTGPRTTYRPPPSTSYPAGLNAAQKAVLDMGGTISTPKNSINLAPKPRDTTSQDIYNDPANAHLSPLERLALATAGRRR